MDKIPGLHYFDFGQLVGSKLDHKLFRMYSPIIGLTQPSPSQREGFTLGNLKFKNLVHGIDV